MRYYPNDTFVSRRLPGQLPERFPNKLPERFLKCAAPRHALLQRAASPRRTDMSDTT